jgi:2-polyprenyl-3-methyl-5-hydroxy-6-metoxy-1,4-benzoquinol methylase
MLRRCGIAQVQASGRAMHRWHAEVKDSAPPAPEIPCIRAACPLCGSAGPHPVLLRVRRLSLFNTADSPPCRIDVVRCDRCGMMRLDPRPDDATLAKLQRDRIGDSEREVGSLETGNSNPDYPPMLARRLAAAGFPGQGGHLLDVGCGSGNLLASVSGRLGAAATGLDVSEAALERARRRFPAHRWIRAAAEPEALPREAFDAVTLIHVLEHSQDPAALLAALRAWLRPGGILVAEVPNGEFYFSRFYSIFLESPKALLAAILRTSGRKVPFTARGFYPYHLSLFGPGSLRAMAEKAGLEVISLEMSICRLEWWLKENRRRKEWPRYFINRLKLALARRGLGDNLFLVARRPAGR